MPDIWPNEERETGGARIDKEVDSTLGRAGLGSAIVALFYKPQPPNGVGMACASGNAYSYASVRVTGTALTVTPRGPVGQARARGDRRALRPLHLPRPLSPRGLPSAPAPTLA